MPTLPDQFPKLAALKAASPEVAQLFTELTRRAETFASMQDQLLETITKHREAREGRPVRLTKRQHHVIAGFQADADKAARDMSRHIANMDDAALLSCALSSAHQQINLDERLYPGFHEDDKPAAQKLLTFQRETLKTIWQFIEASPFRGKIKSIWPGIEAHILQ